MNQFETSIIHREKIASGCEIVHHRTEGDGDNAVSLVRYSDGEVYRFDNASGQAIADVWGWDQINLHESAWFLTRGQAEQFGRDCLGVLGEPRRESMRRVALCEILRISEIANDDSGE